MVEGKKRNVFILGDSVSIHYGPYLKEMIKGKFNYDRKRGINEALLDLDKPIGANGGDSSMVLYYLKEEKNRNVKYDILLINCGLHDIRVHRDSLENQVSEKDYSKNLYEIIQMAKDMSNEVIWITTTPIIDEIHNSRKEGFLRYSKDLEKYNRIAEEILSEKDVDIIDLYGFTRNLGINLYCDHVHFVQWIRKLQGVFIAENLLSNKNN